MVKREEDDWNERRTGKGEEKGRGGRGEEGEREGRESYLFYLPTIWATMLVESMTLPVMLRTASHCLPAASS